MRIVDLWAAGELLTTDDNQPYAPSLIRYMRLEAAKARDRDVRPNPFPGRSPEEVYRLLEADAEAGGSHLPEQLLSMRWDPITDNVTSYSYRDGEQLVIVFRFRRETHPFPENLGKVFVARIPPDEFADVVGGAADLLQADLPR